LTMVCDMLFNWHTATCGNKWNVHQAGHLWHWQPSPDRRDSTL